MSTKTDLLFSAPTLEELDRICSALAATFSPSLPLEPPSGANLGLDDLPRARDEIFDDVEAQVVRHAVQCRHRQALAHMVPPPLTIAVLADLLIGALNQCAFIWEEAPLAATVERAVIEWLLRQIGFGSGSSGQITSGGTMSNSIATLLALKRAEARGVGLQRVGIVASDQAHLSVEKAALLTGAGLSAVSRASTNRQGNLSTASIDEAAGRLVDAGRVPVLFTCTAGTTNTGAIEPFDVWLESARFYDAWLHVDAAHGGFLALLNDERAGRWAEADSLSWDPHKSLYLSYACGALLLRSADSAAPLRFYGTYALKREEFADAGIEHYEGSRRFEALKLWMCIRELGASGFAELAETSLTLAASFAEEIEQRTDLELVSKPETNVVCFRLRADALDPAQRDEHHETVQRILYRGGGPLLSTTRIGGAVAFRAVLLNPTCTRADLAAALDRVVDTSARELEPLPSSKVPG